MTAWNALLRKDLFLTKTRSVIYLALLIAVEGLLVYWAYADRSKGYGHFASAGLIMMIMFFHFMYLPVHIRVSLTREWRKSGHLWLHLPQSGWLLLLSKFISGLITMIPSLVITYLFALWIFGVETQVVPGDALGELRAHSLDVPTILSLAKTLTLLIGVAATAIGLYIAAWVALFSIVMRAFKNQLGKLRWLIGVAIILIATWGMDALQSTSFYQSVTSWGSMINLLHLPAQIASNVQPDATVWAGDLIFHAIFALVLFYISGLLIDKKVEV